MTDPQVSIVIPSLNQGEYLGECIESVLSQPMNKQIIVCDGGSTDNSVEVIKQFEKHLTYWVSEKDQGQADAINRGVLRSTAPYVCWLNSDDFFLPNGLAVLYNELENSPLSAAAYGQCLVTNSEGLKKAKYLTRNFNEYLFANFCFICQPGTLIRHSAWRRLDGLDITKHFAFDYDLWWRLYREAGDLTYVKSLVAATRHHSETKTHNNLKRHYQESMEVVRQNYGKVPIKWYTLYHGMKVFRLFENKLFR